MKPLRIGYAGTDGRSFLAALDTSRAKSDRYPGKYQGVVVRGAPAMLPWAEKLKWPVDFIPTADNSVSAYAKALIQAFKQGDLDVALVMPESLLFEGLVDQVVAARFGDRIIGLDSQAAFLEGDKIACKEFCMQADIPITPNWRKSDARDYK